MTAHIDALELQRTLDTHFDALIAAGKPLPKSTAVKKTQLSARRRTFDNDVYRGVHLEAIPERKSRRKADTANWVQDAERVQVRAAS